MRCPFGVSCNTSKLDTQLTPLNTGKPITNKMNVGIRIAVLRDRWNLHHRDIRLKQFLGKGGSRGQRWVTWAKVGHVGKGASRGQRFKV